MVNGETDAVTGIFRPPIWRRARAATWLTVVVTAGLVVAVMSETASPWIIGPAILGLDIAGAVYSWRAARSSPSGLAPWRLIGAGRAVSVATTACLSASALGAGPVLWWAGSLTRLLMYVLIAAGVFVSVGRQAGGRTRTALFAEAGTVVAAGFMVVWYLTLEPVLARQPRSAAWIVTIGWPLGDLLLLGAVSAVVLRGAVTRFSRPVTIFAAGLLVYLAADVIRAAVGGSVGQESTDPAGVVTLVAASLLMTVAAMLTVAGDDQAYQRRTSKPPAWATQLPMTAMLVGGLLMFAVTVREGELLPWGGLVGGLIAMTCTAALRQIVAQRESRDRIITDPLTGLANREGLDSAIERCARHDEAAALLLIDLDGFKLVNDAYGHAAGDDFLAHVARQLRDAVRAESVCARIGGDEFAILLPGVTDIEQAAAVAERILAIAAAHPVVIQDDVVPVRASIGVALTEPGFDTKSALRHADIAMYQSKRAGSHGYTCYEPTMVDHRTADAVLADEMEHALPRGEFYLLFQPLVDLAGGRPVAAEALLRWQHPTRGLVSPVQFIPVAERSGLITAIGLWVLEQALAELMTIAPPFYISVNVSPRQLREPSIARDILAIVDRSGADPRRLVLEVTESALVDETSGIGALRVLREHGIRIAIDDFGTGYSSLQYLTRLPVDILKIDRSFVAELDTTREGSAVTEAIVRLAQVLHLSTVAEGIETESQATELRDLGCGIGQGFLFAKPLTAEDFAAFLAGAPRLWA